MQHYFIDPWNSFDALIVVGSVLDIAVSEFSVSSVKTLVHILLGHHISKTPICISLKCIRLPRLKTLSFVCKRLSPNAGLEATV